ncbi:MAG: hypothetical protein GXX86_12705, partial [Propionibacterium sp.]|nr:hypothetical protein [Propionibacterium sp.]
MDPKLLPRAVRAELRGLSPEAAEAVGAHLVAAGQLIDVDPELAFRHAEAARRRGSRLPVVREASAETAYAAGEYAHALQEYRALRRMTGEQIYLPVIADCERALGRPQEALSLVREARGLNLPGDTRVELLLVEAGARSDLGQVQEAHRLLRDALRNGIPGASSLSQARLAYAFAEALLSRGREAQARTWFERAADWDAERQTDAADRRDELDGLLVEFDDSDDPEVASVELDDGVASVESDELGVASVEPDDGVASVEQDPSGSVSKPATDHADPEVASVESDDPEVASVEQDPS